jgi:hypothetical protein
LTLQDFALLFLGCICAAGVGVTWPIWSILFSSSLKTFSSSEDVLESDIVPVALGFVYLGAASAFVQAGRAFVFRSQAEVCSRQDT